MPATRFRTVAALLLASLFMAAPAPAAATVDIPEVSLASMQNGTCVINLDHEIYCWGGNDYGQLGINIFGAPVGISGREATNGTDWRALFDSSGNHMCAIKSSGTLWCWGLNFNGQLGLNDFVDRSVPTQVGSDSDWIAGAAGQYSTCAIKSDRTLWCWGQNDVGQAGNGTSGADNSTPVQADGSNWAGVSMGRTHACALKTDNTLWCWGDNADGQLGISSLISQTHPTQVSGAWKQVDTSADGPGSYTCAIKTDNTLWCWGQGGWAGINTLGTGATTASNAPLEVGGTWSQIASGAWTACGIKLADKSLWCWGDGWKGNLATGIAADENDSDVPVAAAGGAAWATIARGRDHACAAHTNGSVWCWGQNTAQALGTPVLDADTHSTPIDTGLFASGIVLPSTDRDTTQWSMPLMLLAALTAAAGIATRRSSLRGSGAGPAAE